MIDFNYRFYYRYEEAWPWSASRTSHHLLPLLIDPVVENSTEDAGELFWPSDESGKGTKQVPHLKIQIVGNLGVGREEVAAVGVIGEVCREGRLSVCPAIHLQIKTKKQFQQSQSVNFEPHYSHNLKLFIMKIKTPPPRVLLPAPLALNQRSQQHWSNRT